MAILTVTATESGTISGNTISDTETITIDAITNIYHAKFFIDGTTNSTSSSRLLYNGDTAYSTGNGDPYGSIKYCRITNVDDSADLKLIIEFNDKTYYGLGPGESLILYDFQRYSALTSEDTAPLTDPPYTVDQIQTIGHHGGDCWVEIFMAATGGL